MRNEFWVLLLVGCITIIFSIAYLVYPIRELEAREFSELRVLNGTYFLENYVGAYGIVRNRIGFYREYEITRSIVSKINSTNLNIIIQEGKENGLCYLKSSGIYTLQPGTIYLSNSIIIPSDYKYK